MGEAPRRLKAAPGACSNRRDGQKIDPICTSHQEVRTRIQSSRFDFRESAARPTLGAYRNSRFWPRAFVACILMQ